MLNQLKVLDFSQLLPGPFASMWLADLGADVIRIEPTHGFDEVRAHPPFEHGTSAAHAMLNRGKRSLAMDLKSEKAKAVIHRLLKTHDVLLESYRPGVMARLGLDYEVLKKDYPKLIFCSITGFGQTGPDAKKPGHDINFLARSGVLNFSGTKESGPAPIGVQLADIAGGAYPALVGILAAVIHRQQTGLGQHLDISMTESMLQMTAFTGAATLMTGQSPGFETESLSGATFYGCYQTKDERYLSVAPIEKKFWVNFCACINRPDLIDTGFNHDEKIQTELKTTLASVFAQKTLSEWCDVFAGKEVCVEPVQSLGEVFADEHMKERGVTVAVPVGGQYQQQIACPLKTSATQGQPKYIGRPLGEDSLEILQSLDFSESEIAELECSKTVLFSN